MPGTSRFPPGRSTPAGCGRTGPSSAGARAMNTRDGPGPPGCSTRPRAAFAHIDTGYHHSCAVGRDGIVECWGGSYSDDDDALLTPEERAMRKALLGPPEDRFTSVSVGLWLDCGVKVDNSAECWGLGPATSDELKPPHGKYTSVSVGDFHACGIRIDQTVVCWGSNEGFDGDFLGQGHTPGRPLRGHRRGGLPYLRVQARRGNPVLGEYRGGRRWGSPSLRTAT